MAKLIVSLLLAVVSILNANAILKTYEFENARSPNQTGLWRWRSDASEHQSLHVDNEFGEVLIQVKLCLKKAVGRGKMTISLENFRYSNDGPADQYVFMIGNQQLADLATHEVSDAGNGWDKFIDSGKIGTDLEVQTGNRTLFVKISTDTYGAELDNMSINFLDQDPEVDVFCGANVVL